MKNILLYFIGMMVLFAACESGTHSSEQKTNDTTVSLNEPGKDTSGKPSPPIRIYQNYLREKIRCN